MSAKFVIDLSSNNTVTTLNDVRKFGVIGAYVKISEGHDYVNPKASEYISMARSAGLRVGAYHFARMSGNTPNAEAEFFARNMPKITRGDFRPCLDVEVGNPRAKTSYVDAWCRKFVQRIFELTGTMPIIYSYTAYLNAMSSRTPIGAGLWLASYGPNSSDSDPYVLPRPYKACQLRQFTDSAILPGIHGRCDLSAVYNLSTLLAHPKLGLL